MGAAGKLSHDQLLTDPDRRPTSSKADRRRRAGHRHRHQPRRLQVHPASPTGDILAIDRIGRSTPDPEHPPGDARLFFGAAGVAGRSSAEYGGTSKETYGVPVEEIRKASATACARSTSTPTSPRNQAGGAGGAGALITRDGPGSDRRPPFARRFCGRCRARASALVLTSGPAPHPLAHAALDETHVAVAAELARLERCGWSSSAYCRSAAPAAPGRRESRRGAGAAG